MTSRSSADTKSYSTVWPGVFAYGILLVPKNIKPGERRPVVVCQHGLEGRASDTADPKSDSHFYHRFAARLAEEGFVTYAPQNPYIGEDRFRIIQRKGHPLQLSIFSFILGQHQRTLEWLAQQPFVDPGRIGFYGLSYGGKTAMRVPPLLDGYALSICAGDFNEWVWKTTSVDSSYSYLLTREYDMIEFDFANVVNYSGSEKRILWPLDPSWWNAGVTTRWLQMNGWPMNTRKSGGFTKRKCICRIVRPSSSSTVRTRFMARALSLFSESI